MLRLSGLAAASPASPFGSSFKGCYSFLSLQSSVKLDSKSRHLLTVKLNCFGYFHIIIDRGRMVISHLMATEPDPCVCPKVHSQGVSRTPVVAHRPPRADREQVSWRPSVRLHRSACSCPCLSSFVGRISAPCSLLWESSFARGRLLPPSICVSRTCLQLLYF